MTEPFTALPDRRHRHELPCDRVLGQRVPMRVLCSTKMFALGYFIIITSTMEIFFRSMGLAKFVMAKVIKDNAIKYLKEEGAKEGICAPALRKAKSI